MKFYAALIEHRYGTDLYAAKTDEELYQKLYEYVEQWWPEEMPKDLHKPDDHVDMVHAYFNWYLENSFGGSRDEYLTLLGEQEL